MKDFKEQLKDQKIKMADEKRGRAEELLREYLLAKPWEDVSREAEAFLEENSGASLQALQQDLEDETDKVLSPENSPEDREFYRAGILAQYLWEGASHDQREEWYRAAKKGEKLEVL